MAATRLTPIRVGEVSIEVEAVPVAGTEATSSRTAMAAENVVDAFERAEDVILNVARSTAAMIKKAGTGARPGKVEVEFGLKFSASGSVIMAGVAGEASLRVTLTYDGTPTDGSDAPRDA
jgi:hypothetical protein